MLSVHPAVSHRQALQVRSRDSRLTKDGERKRRRRAAADLGWRASWWSLNPPQDQRSPGLRETSLRSLHSHGAVEVNRHRERERERERKADMQQRQ